jgi:hypothetical protein
VRVRLIREGVEIESYGKLVYARPDFGTGIAFTVIEPKDEVVLALNGRLKSGQRWSLQNRPTDVARDAMVLR